MITKTTTRVTRRKVAAAKAEKEEAFEGKLKPIFFSRKISIIPSQRVRRKVNKIGKVVAKPW